MSTRPPDSPPPSPAELRRRAEARLIEDTGDISTLPAEQIRAQVHELRVRLVELEMQNEALRATQFALIDARDRYFDLYELAPVGYLTLDEHHHVRSVNLSAADLLGRPRTPLLGARFETLLLSADRDAAHLLLQRSVDGAARQSDELRLDRPADQPSWVRAEAVWYQPSGSDEGEWRVTLHDITAQKAAADALRVSEERFRVLVESASQAVWETNADGQVVRDLPTWRAYTGQSVDELQGAGWSNAIHSDDRVAILRRWGDAVARAAPFQAEFRLRNPQGAWRWTSVHAAPIMQPDGSVAKWVGMNLDITDRKEAEAALHKLNETLELRVAERTSLLELHHDVATAANEAQSIDEALTLVLKRCSEHYGWSFAHAYLLDADDGELLLPVRVHYASVPERFRHFHQALMSLRLRLGQGLPGRVLATRTVQWVEDLAAELASRRAEAGCELGLCCGYGFPIYAGNAMAGVIEVFADHPVAPIPAMVDSMAGLGTQVGRIVERQRFERNVARALLTEQQRLGQDLHDTVGQEIAGLALITERMAQRAGDGVLPAPAALAELSDTLRQALQNMRSAVHGLLPLRFAHGQALCAALQELATATAQRYDLACAIDCPKQIEIGAPDVAVHLYRIAAEAVVNAAKHARAPRIDLRLVTEDDQLVLTVADDGVGIPEHAEIDGSGLSIMRHRANVIGATFAVRRPIGGGTTVNCILPLENARPRRGAEA